MRFEMELNRRNTQRIIIERANQYVRTPVFEQLGLIAVRERLKLVRKAYDQLLEEHLNLVEGEVRPADLGEQNEYIARIEEIYLDAVERMQTRIELLEQELRPAVEPANLIQNRNEQQPMQANELRLEPMKLENFSGNYRQWSEWRALFDGLIHNNERLSSTQKFHYMKRALTGAAERILSGWQITGENYDEAYNMLVNVYENRYRIVMAHLEELMQLEPCKTENVESIRKLIDTTHRVLRQLNVLNCPVEHWDNIMTYVLISRMAPRTLEAWETTQDLRDMPAVNDVLNFLERRFRGITNFQKSQPSTSTNGATDRLNNNLKYTGTKPKPQTQSANSSQLICYNCRQPHPMHRYPRFHNLSLDERRNRVRDLKLCFNCFKPSHSANSLSCQYGECRQCPGKRHNSLLCPKFTQRRVTVNIVRTSDVNQPQTNRSKQTPATDAPASMFIPPNQDQNF